MVQPPRNLATRDVVVVFPERHVLLAGALFIAMSHIDLLRDLNLIVDDELPCSLSLLDQGIQKALGPTSEDWLNILSQQKENALEKETKDSAEALNTNSLHIPDLSSVPDGGNNVTTGIGKENNEKSKAYADPLKHALVKHTPMLKEHQTKQNMLKRKSDGCMTSLACDSKDVLRRWSSETSKKIKLIHEKFEFNPWVKNKWNTTPLKFVNKGDNLQQQVPLQNKALNKTFVKRGNFKRDSCTTDKLCLSMTPLKTAIIKVETPNGKHFMKCTKREMNHDGDSDEELLRIAELYEKQQTESSQTVENCSSDQLVVKTTGFKSASNKGIQGTSKSLENVQKVISVSNHENCTKLPQNINIKNTVVHAEKVECVQPEYKSDHSDTDEYSKCLKAVSVVGFKTASHKEISVMAKSLKLVEKLLLDPSKNTDSKSTERNNPPTILNTPIAENPSAHCATTSAVLARSTAQFAVGFKTASNKALTVSHKSFSRANIMMKNHHQSIVKDASVAHPSTTIIKEVSKTNSVTSRRFVPEMAAATITTAFVSTVPAVSFTTASKKPLSVSSEALAKAQRLMEEDLYGEKVSGESFMSMKPSEYHIAKPSTCTDETCNQSFPAVKSTVVGFKTASHKNLSVSHAALEKAKHVVNKNGAEKENSKDPATTPSDYASNPSLFKHSFPGVCIKAMKGNSSYKPPRKKLIFPDRSTSDETSVPTHATNPSCFISLSNPKKKQLGVKFEQESQIFMSDESLLNALELLESS
ncbi:uncharacterized protein LOC100185089 [Ciona intestinalis]